MDSDCGRRGTPMEMDAAVTQLLAPLIGGGGASFAIEDGAAHSESHKAAACGGLVWVTALSLL